MRQLTEAERAMWRGAMLVTLLLGLAVAASGEGLARGGGLIIVNATSGEWAAGEAWGGKRHPLAGGAPHRVPVYPCRAAAGQEFAVRAHTVIAGDLLGTLQRATLQDCVESCSSLQAADNTNNHTCSGFNYCDLPVRFPQARQRLRRQAAAGGLALQQAASWLAAARVARGIAAREPRAAAASALLLVHPGRGRHQRVR